MYEFIYMISWNLVSVLPILLFIIGGVKFFVARKKLSEDCENFKYKKSLLVAKELLVNAFFMCCVYVVCCWEKGLNNGLAVEAETNLEISRMKSSLIMYMVTYINIIIALICTYIIMLCLVKKEIKKTKDDSLYLENLKRHKKIINTIYIITLIIYLCLLFITYGKVNSITPFYEAIIK